MEAREKVWSTLGWDQLEQCATGAEKSGLVKSTAKTLATAGATDHVFGFCAYSGSNSHRGRDLKDRKLYTIERPGMYPLLEPLIREAIDPAVIISQWSELIRL